MITRISKWMSKTASGANWISAAMIILMMVLTATDVVLRYFRHPIPGTYEIVGFLSALAISFALAFTAMEKGHIAVEFLVNKLPPRMQSATDVVNNLLASVLFGLIAWQSVLHGLRLMEKGEVSATLLIPVYPFVFGVAAGSALLCLVLFFDFLKSTKKVLGQ
ncbi:MAG: TRAP transporter small permease [Proteobacteria bacterium]|nr:TRAP transporter small permease [Pseudomonadota bacterium]